MYTVLRGIRRRAEQAPPSRERFIDLLRAISIVAVVLGHWLVATVGYDRDGELNGRSALPELPWAHPLTWLVQVMPVFFLVGGYANAASLAAVRRRGGNATGWLLNRSGRLLRPTTALVLVTAGGALAARLFGADPARVRLVAWFASIPLWFLVAYLAVVVLTPVMYALHRRYGLAVPVVLVCLVALGDVARLLGEPFWGNGNFLFGWLAVHQMGFAWRDGLLPSRARVALPLVCGGAASCWCSPSPPLSGQHDQRARGAAAQHVTAEPGPAGVAATQLGVALLLRERGERWLRVSRVWIAVVAVNAVILTIFLWHVSAAILLAAALHAAGVLPVSEAGSAAWFAWRLPLLVMLGLVLVLLVAIAGPIEVRRTGRISGPPPWLVVPVVAGFAAVIAGLLGNSLLPSTSPTLFGWPTPALIAYLAGTAVLRLLRRTSDS
ncbi:acyltransferase family protein [Nonomuraea thailandensis]